MTVRLRRIVVGPLATNCWVLHADGDRRALVVDPGDEPDRVRAAVAGLDVVAVVLTHAHWDHVLGAGAVGAPVLAHADDGPVWPHELATLDRLGHWDAGTATADLRAAGHPLRPEGPLWDGRVDDHLVDGQVLTVGPLAVDVLHTPGHTPGGVSLHVEGHVLTGDTLFPGGPGLTGWPLSDFSTIMGSVRRLAALPAVTAVHPGHGPSTTIGAERPHLDDWEDRGW
ncbi:MBL fold metallo-hydrolase [Pseudonocardia kunmingensis]|uniref:Hydroxyacylglutathione hydrolase n=1 Tax=Pseudonocardia kunmingensis TaxID=630975 RepID=A0A543DIB1_9PSEU|nr:MBL fold metallo-hydrolase [Pseudonocardia kunmingensis]TQM09077.1 hydroxyacylglutathione hydrolase [Pseudonocardia kunmingensis]